MKNLTCIVCPNSCELAVEHEANQGWQVTGHLCTRGVDFAVNELTNPTRTVCSTVKTAFLEVPRLPVRTDREIPRQEILRVMELINTVVLDRPVHSGECILTDVLGTGINVIASSDLYYLLGDEQECRTNVF